MLRKEAWMLWQDNDYSMITENWELPWFNFVVTGLKGTEDCPYDHYDVIKWKHFPRYWPFARGIHRSTVNSPNKGQWRGALMFSLICAWINVSVNNREAGDWRRHRAPCDITIMLSSFVNILHNTCTYNLYNAPCRITSCTYTLEGLQNK